MSEKKGNNLEIIRTELYAQENIDKIASMYGSYQEANAYVTSVFLAVRNSEQLQKCTPLSIKSAAIRAATMRLSVEPSLGQAWLVPYGKESPICTFQIGYRGLKLLAMRTQKYRYINCNRIYQGEDPKPQRNGTFTITPRTGDKTIGWLMYIELINGFVHETYMTIEEIHAHAKKFSKSYNFPDSPWRKHVETMEQKTVLLRALREVGLIEISATPFLSQSSDDGGDDDMIDAEFIPDTQDPVKVKVSKPEPEPEPEPAGTLHLDPILTDKTNAYMDQLGFGEPPAKQEAGQAPSNETFKYNDPSLVARVAKANGWKSGETLMALSTLHKQDKIKDKVTLEEALTVTSGLTLKK